MDRKLLAVWLSLFLVIFSAGYLITYQEKTTFDLNRLARIQEILSIIYDLENNLANAEALTRGYVITGDKGQLGAYQEALGEIQRRYQQLKAITADNPEQQRLLLTLQPLITQRLGLLEKSIELRSRGGNEGPELAAIESEGTKVHNRTWKILDAMENVAKKLVIPGRKTKLMFLALIGGTFLSLTALLVSLYFLNQETGQRKKAEARLLLHQEHLRSLASQLTLAEERERRRIAGYLHDQIGHTLALANIKLGEMQKGPASPATEALGPELGEISTLVKQAIQDSQSLTFQISSPILYELGFEAAVEWLTEQFATKYGILIYFEADTQPKPLDDDVRTLLYQAVNELMVNAVKHAQAGHVKVALWREADELRVEVDNDGAGFKQGEASNRGDKPGGFGLFSIRERLKPFGGRMEVHSETDAGTQIILAVPLKTTSPS
jgi:signal transduction histidine kinase